MDGTTNMKRWVILCFAGITCLLSFAQSRSISGNVIDAAGETMIGVSVMEKGTSNGTITDIDGNFKISVGNNAVLVFNYMGYASQEVKPGNQSVLKVTLVEDTKNLEEFVVIGYGAVKKKDLTGSISMLKSDAIAQVPVANVVQAMSGRMAGVQVTTTDGSPDAEIKIRVRGGGSITQDNSPLYIVDGFPVSSFSDIPSTDIEDITVLKDASSTAIYGAQGANGVILITTKNPQIGKPQVSYNGYMQSKRLSKHLDVMNTYEYVKLQYEMAAIGSSSDLENFVNRFGYYEDMDLYRYQPGTDWQEDMFGNSVVSKQHNISVSGGTETTRYLISGTYNKDGGLMPMSDYSRYNLNVKLSQDITKNLRFNFNARAVDTETNGEGSSGGTDKARTYEAVSKGVTMGLQNFVTFDPNVMTEEELDQWIRENMTLAERAQQYWRQKNSRSYNFDASIEWEIIKGLSYRMEGGYNYGFNENKSYRGYITTDAANNGGKPLVTWQKGNTARWRVLNMLTYNFKLGENHSFNAMAGQEILSNVGNSSTTTAKGFNKDLAPEKIFAAIGLGEGGAENSSTVNVPNNLASFFGRLGYNFGERYLATFTLRADGSSRFGRENKWGYFPSAALAWRVAEESFMEGSKEWLSDLKLRVSYGEAGNNKIDADLFKAEYKISSSGTYALGNTANNYYMLTNTRLANPFIKWEAMITRNAGLDFGFFNQRIWGNIEYYWNSSKDLLLEAKIVAPGYDRMMLNIGQTTNRGVELSLNADIVRQKNFTLEGNFNIGINKSNVDALNSDGNYMQYATGWASTDLKGYNEYEVHVGQPVGMIYGWITDGYYTTSDFEKYDETTAKYILKEGVPTTTLSGGRIGIRPGTIKFKDVSGPNGNPDGLIDDYDRVKIGDANPKFQGGFGFSGTVLKNFDYAMNFSFVYGNDIYNANKAIMSQQYRTSWPNLLNFMNSDGRYTYLADDGTIVTDLATLAAMNEGENAKEYWSPLSFGNSNAVVHSWLIEDGSFLRLQNVTLGYTIPKKITGKFGCQRLRAYCTLNNVWVLTGYSGYDPEVSSPGRGSTPIGMIPGLDYSGYPKSLSWTVGLNVTF